MGELFRSIVLTLLNSESFFTWVAYFFRFGVQYDSVCLLIEVFFQVSILFGLQVFANNFFADCQLLLVTNKGNQRCS